MVLWINSRRTVVVGMTSLVCSQWPWITLENWTQNQSEKFFSFLNQPFKLFFSFVSDVFCFSSDVPKVAFAVSLGGNGLQKTTSGSQTLVYKDVLTNIGQAYNSETGKTHTPSNKILQPLHLLLRIILIFRFHVQTSFQVLQRETTLKLSEGSFS